jgi:hypothetical protein
MITTQEHLDELKKSFLNPINIRKNSAMWQFAFEEYNRLHPEQRPISMGCSACYSKVFKYFQDKCFININPNNQSNEQEGTIPKK